MASGFDLAYDELGCALGLALGLDLFASAPAVAAPPAPAAKPAKAAAPAPAPAPAPAAAAADDDFDIFGDDDDAADAKPEAKPLSLKEKAAAAKAEKAKKKKVERSQVALDVKPFDPDTDLNELFREITAIEIDGLVWGQAYELRPVAYGVNKLVMTCVIEDDKVGVDDIIEPIEAFEDKVQSVDMTSMNRL